MSGGFFSLSLCAGPMQTSPRGCWAFVGVSGAKRGHVKMDRQRMWGKAQTTYNAIVKMSSYHAGRGGAERQKLMWTTLEALPRSKHSLQLSGCDVPKYVHEAPGQEGWVFCTLPAV